ncbi:MAG: hypothetical protein JST95_06555 [Bacteroidetes bacterium]|nr:hypothetical protein [Bacteroidota bacterium]
MNTVRWNIAVSPEVDWSVGMYITALGGGESLSPPRRHRSDCR